MAGPRNVVLVATPAGLSGNGSSFKMPDWVTKAANSLAKSTLGTMICDFAQSMLGIDDCGKLHPAYWFKVGFYWTTWAFWKDWPDFEATWDDPAKFRTVITQQAMPLAVATIAIAFVVSRAIRDRTVLVIPAGSRTIDLG
jgi:hypothetical protein